MIPDDYRFDPRCLRLRADEPEASATAGSEGPSSEIRLRGSEGRSRQKARGRTVVIEDRGLLAFLFLNNNFHAVHHMHPRTAWYRLPALYRERTAHYLARNDGYRFRSYAGVFRQFFWKVKDPVDHPLWPK